MLLLLMMMMMMLMLMMMMRKEISSDTLETLEAQFYKSFEYPFIFICIYKV
jgi:hypothetical protein